MAAERRGFATMGPEKQREIESIGETRKEGESVSRDQQHMAEPDTQGGETIGSREEIRMKGGER